MYNAYLTSDYTIQVEELDNSYGTAQDWADLHEYEEQEMLQAQQADSRVKVLDWHKDKVKMLLINWFEADINEVLAALKVELQQVDPSTPIYIQWEDADHIKDAAPVFDFAFMFDHNVKVVDNYGIIMGCSSYSMD